MKKLSITQIVFALLLSLCCFDRTVQAQTMEGHHFGKYPAINAMIHDGDQKNLDLDNKDFLLEIWFKPLPPVKYKGNAPNVLMSKKTFERLSGFELGYSNDGNVSFSWCDKKMELEKDSAVGVAGAAKENQWSYIAVCYSHRDKKVAFFKDGKILKEFASIDIGNISAQAPFTLAYSEATGGQANCMIDEARVWKFARGLPVDVQAAIAFHGANPQKASDSLVKAASYSKWTFSSSNDDVKDQGNNGNTLCYVPFGYKEGPSIKPFPEKPQGMTYYVDNKNPGASDAAEGTKDRPFKTIQRGARAAKPGDVIHVCAGLYREAVMLRTGENGKPVTLEGEEGTIVTGSDPLGGWEKAQSGLWMVKNWKGSYQGPMDPTTDDARAQPQNLLFVDDQPMDYVLNKVELVPGSWTLEPLLGQNPKTITLYPLPGVDPTKVAVEISEVRQAPLLLTTKFNHVKGIHFTRGSVNLRGVGNLFENNIIDWAATGGLN
jgi:hypothetical protein